MKIMKPVKHLKKSVRRVLAVPGAVLLAASLVAQQAPDDPKFTQALQRGEAAMRVRQFEAALDAFKQANAIGKKTSAVALLGMSRAYHELAAFKTEADTCAEALKYVGDNLALATTVHLQRGNAFVALAQKPTDKALRDAEAEFRGVLISADPAPIAWYNLGVVLLKQNRDPEGTLALQTYIDGSGRPAEVALAKKMIENPRRARELFAPDFSISTMDGEYISLADYQGRVVLLDFWGTWCAPCLAATPSLVDIAKDLAKKPFAMIGISSDKPADAEKLRDYVSQKKMAWAHVHDLSRRIIAPYDVRSYPTYVVIDAEGIVRDRFQGWSGSMAGNLRSSIGKWLSAIPKEK
jgi:thiol-disulfide isomerase/thioredoxin